MQPLYRLNCHEVHPDRNGDHVNSCWERVDIDHEVERIANVCILGDGFDLKWAVKQMDMEDWFDEGDQNQPFFSEAFLYPLLGKEAARTVLAVQRSLFRKLGVDQRNMP